MDEDDEDYDRRDPPSYSVVYYYDPLGRRVAKVHGKICKRFKKVLSQTYAYLGAEDRILLAKDFLGGRTLYVDGNGIDEHLAEVDKFGARTYVTDHLGSVVQMSQSLEKRNYGPFGDADGMERILNRFRTVVYGFTGRQFDPESGTYYYRARTYNPEIGRFHQKDPIGFAGGDANLYRYVGNRPLIHTDPTGQFLEKIIARITTPEQQTTIGVIIGAIGVHLVRLGLPTIATPHGAFLAGLGALFTYEGGINAIEGGRRALMPLDEFMLDAILSGKEDQFVCKI